MVYKRFGFLLLLRLAMLGIVSSGFAYSFNHPDYHAVTLLMLIVVSSLTYELWYFLNKTNREIARFLSAARNADFNQDFDFFELGGGFQILGETFTDILARLKQLRMSQEIELRHLRAMVEHIPVPLISIHQNDNVQILNSAARRLFGINQPTKLSDLTAFGDDFFQQVSHCKAGENRLARIVIEGVDSKVSVGLTEISSHSGSQRLISLLDIGKQLESTQLKAWQDLVRVLTHEIMNSITPVASLAQTTADLTDDMKQKLPSEHPQHQDLEKVANAASTVARRAGNLVDFVSNYRQLTRLPEPNKQKIKIQDIFNHVVQIAETDNENAGAIIISSVSPPELDLYLDRDQIEQTLINLLRNAKQALIGQQQGKIYLRARFNQRGRIILEVSDNGPGIDAKIIDKVFVPYFTTKLDGSGIGLALARQVIISHGGAIKVANNDNGGAIFAMTF
jgi:two-component system, NtrC family, nitrogen regulation sensor histidine kinase NtrY